MAKKRTYTIEMYELHSSLFTVKARSLIEALKVFQDGGAERVDDSQEYIETADSYGMSVETLGANLCNEKALKKLRAKFADKDDILPGIRSIEVAEEEA